MKYSLSFQSTLGCELVKLDGYQLGNLYMDYFNNYLTIDKFAEHNNLTRYEASRILYIGREAFNDKEFFNNVKSAILTLLSTSCASPITRYRITTTTTVIRQSPLRVVATMPIKRRKKAINKLTVHTSDCVRGQL